MDEAKPVRFKTRQRISSLPDGIREMSTSLVKFRHSSFDTKLRKHLSSANAGRRHTIHVPYTVSSSQDFTDESKFCINPGAESYIELCVEGSSIKGGENAVETRNTHFPLLQEAQVTLEPTAGRKIKRLQRLHSYSDEGERPAQTSFQGWACVKSGTNHASPQSSSAKSTFPVIKNTFQDCRRNSLPVSTENMVDLFSLSFSASEGLGKAGAGHTKAAKSNSLPQVTHDKLANLKIDQPEKAGNNITEAGNDRKLTPRSTDSGYHCFRTSQTRSCAESKTKNAYENDKAQAMRTYVEEADAWFNKEEATAVRLFEWLKDQTDNSESR